MKSGSMKYGFVKKALLLSGLLVLQGCVTSSSTDPGPTSLPVFSNRVLLDVSISIPKATGLISRFGEVILESDYLSLSPPVADEDAWPVAAMSKYGSAETGLWGFVDRQGNWIIDPVYQEVFPFSEGIGVAFRADEWFVFSMDGVLLATLDVDECGTHRDGLIPVRRGQRWGAMNVLGEQIIPFNYDYIGRFNHGFASASVGGRWGYIYTDGSIAIDFNYDVTGLALSDDRFTAINGIETTIEVEPVYLPDGVSTLRSRTFVFIDSQSTTSVDSGEIDYELLDAEGNVVLSTNDYRDLYSEFEDIHLIGVQGSPYSVKHTNAIVIGGYSSNEDGWHSNLLLIDLDGHVLIDQIFQEIVLTEHGGYGVDREKPFLIHHFDKAYTITHSILLEHETLSLEEQNDEGNTSFYYFQDDVAVFIGFPSGRLVDPAVDDGSNIESPIIFATATGEELRLPVISSTNGQISTGFPFGAKPDYFSFTAPYSAAPQKVSLSGVFSGDDETVRVRVDSFPESGCEHCAPTTRFVLVDVSTESETLLLSSIEAVRGFHAGFAAAKRDGMWGIIDTVGNFVIPPGFEAISDMINGVAAARTNGKWGYINTDGTWLLEPQFEYALPFMGRLAPVWNGERWGYIDRNGTVRIDFMFAYAEPFRNGWAVVADGFEGARVGYDGELSLFLSGRWYVIRLNGEPIIGTHGNAIWRLFGDEVLIRRDADEYWVRNVFDGRHRRIVTDRVDLLPWRLRRRPRLVLE